MPELKDVHPQNFTANAYLRLRWKVPRLANPEAAIRTVLMEEGWNPRLLLATTRGLFRTHSLKWCRLSLMGRSWIINATRGSYLNG